MCGEEENGNCGASSSRAKQKSTKHPRYTRSSTKVNVKQMAYKQETFSHSQHQRHQKFHKLVHFRFRQEYNDDEYDDDDDDADDDDDDDDDVQTDRHNDFPRSLTLPKDKKGIA
eukprot:6293210-Amphidinium_carterae.1